MLYKYMFLFHVITAIGPPLEFVNPLSTLTGVPPGADTHDIVPFGLLNFTQLVNLEYWGCELSHVKYSSGLIGLP